MAYTHTVRFLRLSPKKMQLIAKGLPGQSPKQAIEWLTIQRQQGADFLAKGIAAAINNAKQADIDLNKQQIVGVSCGQGPVFMRRWMRAKGRSTPKRKPTVHAMIVFSEKKATKQAASKTKTKQEKK